MKYLVVVEHGKEGWGAHVPDLPGCIAAGKSREETLRLIREAIVLHIEGLHRAGEAVPTPSSEGEVIDVDAAHEPQMRVFLDDERVPPPGWVLVRWPEEAIALLEQGDVAEISLDHDLGDDRRGTGYDVVLWIERAVVERGFEPPLMRVHSANSSARLKMEAGIEAIARLRRSRQDPD